MVDDYMQHLREQEESTSLRTKTQALDNSVDMRRRAISETFIVLSLTRLPTVGIKRMSTPSTVQSEQTQAYVQYDRLYAEQSTWLPIEVHQTRTALT